MPVNKKEFLQNRWEGNCYNCAGDLIGFKDEFNCLYGETGYIGLFEKTGELFDAEGKYLGELVDLEVTGKQARIITDPANGVNYDTRIIFDERKSDKRTEARYYEDKKKAITNEGKSAIEVPDGYKDLKKL